jgi:serine/threonine protein phosphatase PrpC
VADVSGRSYVGKRENQEDAFEVIAQSEDDPSGDLLMIVSDGMGGHVGGEVASNLAVHRFREYFVSESKEPKVRERLLASLHQSNAAIAKRIQTDTSVAGMGCTLIGALKNGDRLSWASVGDSHIYLLRDGHLKKLNADHSVYGELSERVLAGKITQEEADNHPRKNALRSALVGGDLSLIDVNSKSLVHGDVIIMATDGLDSLPLPRLTKLLAQLAKNEARKISTALLDAVQKIDAPNQDNTTVVVYRHQETGLSSLSPDSKWGVAATPKSVAERIGKLGFVISGLCGLTALALIITVIAFRSSAPPPPQVTDEQLAVPPAVEPREAQIIGDQSTDIPNDATLPEQAPRNEIENDIPATEGTVRGPGPEEAQEPDQDIDGLTEGTSPNSSIRPPAPMERNSVGTDVPAAAPVN